jgi:hypothetical protein
MWLIQILYTDSKITLKLIQLDKIDHKCLKDIIVLSASAPNEDECAVRHIFETLLQ